MKRIGLLAFCTFFCFQSLEAREYDRDYLTARQKKFQNMRNTGFTMGILGSVMTVGGIVLVANGEWETETDPTGRTQTNAKDGAAAGGLLLIIGGIPIGVAGFILGGIGSRKVGQYRRLLENMEMGMEIGPQRKGLRLSYSF